MIQPEKNECKTMEEYDKWMKKFHEKLDRNNSRILKAVKSVKGEAFHDELKQMLEDDCADMLSIVCKTEGKYQTEDYELIRGSWVDQYVSGGYNGDTYEGNCFIELKSGRYLKFHYSM